MPILETSNLEKIYGKNEAKVKALKNANICVEKGEFVAVTGSSGSGKSTLLHLLGGLERPDKGTIKVNGKDISSLSEKKLAEYRRKEVGFIFQQYNLISILNVRENIELPLLIGNDSIDNQYIDKLISVLELTDRVKHLPGQLSGGQQQRVAIARSLATKPGMILADEPTGNLDSKSAQNVMKLLQTSCKEFNQTLIMVTHDIDLAHRADRVISIVDGEIQ